MYWFDDEWESVVGFSSVVSLQVLLKPINSQHLVKLRVKPTYKRIYMVAIRRYRDRLEANRRMKQIVVHLDHPDDIPSSKGSAIIYLDTICNNPVLFWYPINNAIYIAFFLEILEIFLQYAQEMLKFFCSGPSFPKSIDYTSME